jgi:triacylglycerol esterase/lipase EstA (alpha/beta hydrolase family)
MHLRRMVRVARAAHAISLASAVGLVAFGCGSASPSAAPPNSVLSGQYEATGAGKIAEMSFPDSTHYALWPSACSGGPDKCLETGTYAFNAARDTLILTNGATGQVSSMTFQVVTSGPSATQSLYAPKLRAQGGNLLSDGGSLESDGGSSLIATVLTFLLGGQSFSGNDASPAPPLFPNAGPGTCKYPIVLEHGFAASNTPDSPWAMAGVPQDLMAAGHVLVVADEVQPFGDATSRAATMAQTIANVAKQCATTPGCDPSGVHVIAHSYGGLHSREYLLEHPPANAAADGLPKTISLTTVSTPNYGTAVADTGLAVINAGGTLAGEAADAFAGLFGSTFTSTQLATDSDVKGALETLSEANAPAFAASHPAVAGVAYFAWAGVSVNPNYVLHPIHPEEVTGAFPADCGSTIFVNQDPDGTVHDSATQLVLVAANDITGHLHGDANDGLATIPSAKALPGSTFMGCIPADHLAEVGHTTASTTNWTGFDHLKFYRYVAAGLATLENH